MLYTHLTEKLLGLQGVKVNKIENDENTLVIHAEMERKLTKCPCCGTATKKIHDYRTQTIKDIPAFGKIHSFCCENAATYAPRVTNAFLKRPIFFLDIIE